MSAIDQSRLTRFTNNGLDFDVVDAGPVDGTPVVLLHGFPQRATSWEQVTPILNADGYRTYAADQRGYSPGARPRARSAYRGDRLAGDVVALIERIGQPVHLVGHDWGAAIAWLVAGSRPDLVRSLTAVSVTHPKAFVRSLRTWDQLKRSWYMLAFQLPALPERLLSRPRDARRAMGGTGMTREMVERFGREMVADGALRGGLNWYRAIPLTPPGQLGDPVRVPTTMVWSDADTALGRRGAVLADQYVVGAPYTLEVLEGVSHWIPDQAPDRLAAIIRERAASA